MAMNKIKKGDTVKVITGKIKVKKERLSLLRTEKLR